MGETVVLSVNVDGTKLVIGTLSQDKFPRISFDLVFEKSFELSHNCTKGSVHFIGYKSPNKDQDEEGDYFSGSEEEEEVHVAVTVAVAANGNAGAAALAVVKADSKPKAKPEEVKPESDDEDDQEIPSAEHVVNPWEMSAKDSGKIDYDKLIDKFGCKRIDESLIYRVERLTSRQPHVFLRRGVFIAHRDFDKILDAYERGEKFYLYTGIEPSSEALRLGHLIPFMFARYLQEAFKVPLVIQLPDDTYFLRRNVTIEESKRLTRENAKDIIACGIDITKTFIFSNFDYPFRCPSFYRNMCNVSHCLTVKQMIYSQ